MGNEVWKEIDGFEGLYAISNFGNVKRLEHSDTHCKQGYRVFKERPLKPFLRRGYLKVNLFKGDKRHSKSVHRLVAQAFIPNDDTEKTQINHIDGNKVNNNKDNLEWCTCKENIAHAIRMGLFHANSIAESEGAE